MKEIASPMSPPEGIPQAGMEMVSPTGPKELVAIGQLAVGDGDPDPDDKYLSEWLLDNRTPEKQAASDLDDLHAQLYMGGSDLSHLKEGEDYQGATAASLAKWYTNLDPERKEYIDEQRQAVAQERDSEGRIEAAIKQTAPELLIGHLPADLEDLVKAKYSSYIVGTNQSGIFGVTEAQTYLEDESGVDISGYNLDQRFLLFDAKEPHYARSSVIQGYYGVNFGGKFVMALPFTEEADAPTADETTGMTAFYAMLDSQAPEDFEIYHPDGKCAVNAKYIAGFIDDEGYFHRNANFMKQDQPQLMDNPADHNSNWL